MPALYPNHDADIARDKVLQEHIEKLKIVISPGHKDLKIPRRFQYECPWPSAQVNYMRRVFIVVNNRYDTPTYIQFYGSFFAFYVLKLIYISRLS